MATLLMLEMRSVSSGYVQAVGGYGVVQHVDIRALHLDSNFWHGVVEYNERVLGDMRKMMSK